VVDVLCGDIRLLFIEFGLTRPIDRKENDWVEI